MSLSHYPSVELIAILEDFKSSMLKPRTIFDKFYTKAKEEEFSDEEIKILLSSKELTDVIPKGSLRYYMQEFGLITSSKNKLSNSTITNDDNNDIEETALEKFRREHGKEQSKNDKEEHDDNNSRPETISSENFWVPFEIRISTRKIIYELLIDPVKQQIIQQSRRD